MYASIATPHLDLINNALQTKWRTICIIEKEIADTHSKKETVALKRLNQEFQELHRKQALIMAVKNYNTGKTDDLYGEPDIKL